MAKRAKRASRPNPRTDRNMPNSQENIIELNTFKTSRKKRVEIIPRNLAQERYVDALYDENQFIIFVLGPAGCGKTMLATQYGIKGLREGLFDHIVITRPAVSVDEQHGFLPGTLVQKMEPWMMPILDVFKEHYHPKELARMIEDGIVEISPLAYMRGRTFKNAFIIADEMQNSTVSQTKMVLTRIGENSRIVVTGDLNQHDRGFEQNGMKDFVARFKGSPQISVVEFTSGDVERHPVIEEILRLYGEI
jgi:phosphate starvation-inducible PhoH-like protein